MRRRTAVVAVYVAAFFTLIAVLSQPAHAYIDPGSGSYIVYILVAALGTIGLTIATFWSRVKLFFYKLTKNKAKTDEIQGRLRQRKDSDTPEQEQS